MKLLIIGQAPAASGAGLPAFHPSTVSGRRLAAAFGVADVRKVAQTINLIGRFPGKDRHRKGDRFPIGRAARAARRLELSGFDAVVLAGRYVARAFGEKDRPFMRRFRIFDGTLAVILPHPSGVNRWWNDAKNRRRASSLLRRLRHNTR